MKKEDLKPTLLNGSRDELAPGLSRRSFFMAAGATGVGAAATMLGSTSAKAHSTDWLQPGNNNHVIDLQGTTGGAVEGSVGVDFFGHCAIKITSPGGGDRAF